MKTESKSKTNVNLKKEAASKKKPICEELDLSRLVWQITRLLVFTG